MSAETRQSIWTLPTALAVHFGHHRDQRDVPGIRSRSEGFARPPRVAPAMGTRIFCRYCMTGDRHRRKLPVSRAVQARDESQAGQRIAFLTFQAADVADLQSLDLFGHPRRGSRTSGALTLGVLTLHAGHGRSHRSEDRRGDQDGQVEPRSDLSSGFALSRVPTECRVAFMLDSISRPFVAAASVTKLERLNQVKDLLEPTALVAGGDAARLDLLDIQIDDVA